ncbi:MAG: amidohydrolase [Verrucomicrobia bacterium CG_4_10_14_3_um_filter_43_23]|nr:MAG: amidohydrolase [Verrucomicrobia bacterium CG22_combo_CG10-13_8_21_14_all_43_17]PIX58856.1 MAG: amidohydrolase [Verrucomicrobia bacterium CG_4_10_14_3_um_filter_43_23]PIY60951.1 MAG: amidohydrolase [Verrucomicrobia bacterium CG_4_10_14_0_8_um_filter_43_34]PJA44866.1 MAG: amidohydrolase [Verrucomicrobia bacterium CG_4_9_14_3_um_filter_43_20]
MIIDSHIHHYPKDIVDDPCRWADEHNEPHWGNLVCHQGEKRALQGWASHEKLFHDMDTAGVSRVVLLGWYWQNFENCVWQNNHHIAWVKENPERFIGFMAVQPLVGNKALEDCKRCYDLGLRGIGEVFPAAQGFKLENPTWVKIVEWAIENEIPINMHVSEPVGHHYPGKIDFPLVEIQRFVQRYPELKLILAHWGGLLPFFELNKACAKDFKHVYYDTAASPLLYDKRVFKAVVDLVGPEKILFGSDYPLCLYPKKQTEPDFITFIDEIKSTPLSAEELDYIFYKNAQKLFQL